jgi:hypothetical protein
VSKHAVEAIDKVQAQKNVVGVELEKSLDFVNNGFNPGCRPYSQLEGGEQTGESARREKAKGQRRGSTKENLRDRDWPDAAVLLPGWDKATGQKPSARGRVNATTRNILQEGSETKKKKRIFS